MGSSSIRRGRPRSRLSPHRHRIVTLRAQFISYTEISGILAGEGTFVSAGTLAVYRWRRIPLAEIEHRRTQLAGPRVPSKDRDRPDRGLN